MVSFPLMSLLGGDDLGDLKRPPPWAMACESPLAPGVPGGELSTEERPEGLVMDSEEMDEPPPGAEWGMGDPP